MPVIDRTHLGGPEDTRVHDRWYAKLLPSVEVTVGGFLYKTKDQISDPTVLPGRVWQAVGQSNSRVQFEVFARWDLMQVLLGDNNVSNPNLIIEANIRQKRDEVIDQVRWHYREVAELTHELAHPPADAVTELEWRMRLEEYASYLEFLSGKKVVDRSPIQPGEGAATENR